MRPMHPPDRDAADLDVDPDAFTDRVMASIEATPAPTPARSFMGALRGWSLDDAMASLAVAWHLATVRTWSVAPRVRARSMALVLAVVTVLATGSLVAAAAVRVAAPFAADDHHMAPPTVPAGGITDPELDDHATDRDDPGTSLDADHHVAEPVVEPMSSDKHTTKKAEDGATDPGSQGEDTGGGGDRDGAHDGEHAGSGTQEGGDDGGDAHGGGSTSDSHDGGTSDGGSHGTSGGDGGHDDDGGNGGD